MPEHTEFSVHKLAVAVGFDSTVYTKILMVSRQYFCDSSVGVVKDDKVFEQVEKCSLIAYTAQHGLQFHIALIFLFESFPFVEKLIFTAESSDFSLIAITQHQKCVVVEQLRNGVEVVGIVIVVCVLNVNVGGFGLNEKQGYSVDKTNYISASAI